MNLAALLMALAAPIAKRIMIALGFGLVSFAGVSVALNSLLTSAKNAWGGTPADVLNILQLSGSNTAFSIIAGAMVARVGLLAVKRLQQLI